jgi:hypothetical protein
VAQNRQVVAHSFLAQDVSAIVPLQAGHPPVLKVIQRAVQRVQVRLLLDLGHGLVIWRVAAGLDERVELRRRERRKKRGSDAAR